LYLSEDWLIGALELYCPRLMMLIVCVGLIHFYEGGRGWEKKGYGVIGDVKKGWGFHIGGWLGIGGIQGREG
jgi:hypothetical protein